MKFCYFTMQYHINLVFISDIIVTNVDSLSSCSTSELVKSFNTDLITSSTNNEAHHLHTELPYTIFM